MENYSRMGRPLQHGLGAAVRSRRKGRRTLRAAAARRKLRELRTLVPGGEGLRADQLLLRTADYIFHLRFQVHVLHALSKLYMP